ncbi:hypothetical protein [Ktedonospora formicarum]|uniref:Uncharacterized protein n=1 Tax=Ktedonospora formicarum TaxID=2778364 RepID=A0A8J3HUK8_9CHLR|nr:hypothetical protein [Ktedonospora formicarum]GHO44312.1 hypothetical protein KSX_24750 [Ktedonospora formicarum]
MTSNTIERAEKRMQQKWYELARAEQDGAPPQALERMFNAYMLAVEEYNRCSEQYLVKQREVSDTVPAIRGPLTDERKHGKRRKAS